MKLGSAFCQMYGSSSRNKVLEYLLENRGLDVAVGDIAKDTNLSRPKTYEIIDNLENNLFIVKSRIVGRTQLYKLNEKDNKVQHLINDFTECLKLVISEHESTKSTKKQKVPLVVTCAQR